MRLPNSRHAPSRTAAPTAQVTSLASFAAGRKPASYTPVQPAQNVFSDPPGFVMPQEFVVAVPEELFRRFPNVLVKDGNFSSHLENETKWGIPKAEGAKATDAAPVDAVLQKFEALLADPKLVEQVFGKGFKMGRVDKYYEKDASGKVLIDSKTSRPVTSPMNDIMVDDAELRLGKSQAIVRVRKLKGDPFNILNVKPDAGVVDKTGTNTRREYSIEIQKDCETKHPEELKAFLQAVTEHLNPARFLAETVPGFDPLQATIPSVQLSDERFKYELLSPTGLGLEMSVDDVTAWEIVKSPGARPDPSDRFALPPGYARGRVVRYGQIEFEENHAQLVKTPPPPPTPEEFRAWMEANQGKPQQSRVHALPDLENGEFKNTPEYREHADLNTKLWTYLFGKVPVVGATQKSHAALKLLGKI